MERRPHDHLDQVFGEAAGEGGALLMEPRPKRPTQPEQAEWGTDATLNTSSKKEDVNRRFYLKRTSLGCQLFFCRYKVMATYKNSSLILDNIQKHIPQ